ncbi:hypothetical protein B0H14DRAFT_3468293 [Mycena olivaceomarginata]|nr:hypothetical protein B0H14DRAFT_3468293 [Mycena olivaceomarginata]
MVGYQGWFTCAGDGPPIGEGHHGWLHWIDQPLTAPANGRPNTDLWPDTSAYDPSELYPPGARAQDGAPARVFSSRDARTVNRHFRWMAEHGVDGAFLQRFVGQVDPEEAGNGTRVNANSARRYDASGVPPSQILRILTQDFTHLLHDERILSSPAYLRERGRPVVALWGFGLSDSQVDAALARACFDALRASRANTPQILAGTDKTTARSTSSPDGAVDAVSPWSVGRFSDKEEVERWAVDRWGGDADLGFNLSEGKWAFNGIKRNGGKFLWAQVFHAKGSRAYGRCMARCGMSTPCFFAYILLFAFIVSSPAIMPSFIFLPLFPPLLILIPSAFSPSLFLPSYPILPLIPPFVLAVFSILVSPSCSLLPALAVSFLSHPPNPPILLTRLPITFLYDEGTAFLPVVEKKRLLPESDKWPFLALDEEGYDLPADW